jgi:lysophospholipase L1-like esterase
MFYRVMISTVIGLVATTALWAQLSTEFTPPGTACCLLGNAERLAQQLQDWSQLGRYHKANVQLKAAPRDPGRVVFMGDSITDGWKLDQYFPGKPFVNRGIGGQTTAQMLVRFYPDVIALQPAAVVILAGTNDIARNNGMQTLEMIRHNIMAMVELAKVHHIKVVLCALTPINDYKKLSAQQGGGPNLQSKTRPPADILTLNAWLKVYAAAAGAVYADYHAATRDADGFLVDADTNDGLHPNAGGYARMVPVVTAAIEQALRLP